MLNVRVRPLLTLAAAGILIAIGGCAEQPAGPASAPQYTKIALPEGVSFSRAGTAAHDVEVIGPEGGVLSAGGHTLQFPAGAVSRPTRISMTAIRGLSGVDLQPHGLVFPANAQPLLTLNHAGADLSGFSWVRIGYFGTGGTLEELFATTHSADGTTSSAHLPHFSGYLLAGG